MKKQFFDSEILNKIIKCIAEQISHFSPQLFLERPKQYPLPLASSVLLFAYEKYFLISSAHTFEDENLENIGIMIENNFCPIGGKLWWLEPNVEGKHDSNKQDIAIFKLDEITVANFKKKYKFLTGEKLLFNHESSSNSRYLVVGYPEKKTRKDFPTKEVIPTTLTICLFGLDKPYYIENNFNYKQFLQLSIQEEKTKDNSNFERKIPLPELEGISGCGVWNISNLSIENTQYELVSILTGQNHSRSILHSTKVDVLLNYLKTL